MKRKMLLGSFLCMMAMSLISCATYTPSLVKMDPYGPNAGRETKGDLCLYVEEYATPAKSEKAFDTNLIKEGVLPLLVQVQNHGPHPYDLRPMNIVIREGDAVIKALTPEQAATKAKRNPVFRALGWSMIVPIVSIPVAVAASAVHTSKVNKQIRQDFTTKGLTAGVIMPNKEQSGFLFFELDKGRKDLSGLSLEVTARNETTGEFLTINTPLPAATFKPRKEVKPQEEPKEEVKEW